MAKRCSNKENSLQLYTKCTKEYNVVFAPIMEPQNVPHVTPGCVKENMCHLSCFLCI